MSTGDLINIHPSELKFPFELKKQSSCSMQLSNKTDQYVAFKVKTTNPKKYCVRPNTGVVSPGSSCSVTVTMQAQKEAPADMQCKDTFLVQSVIAPEGATTKDLAEELFSKESGNIVEECKLKVVYVSPPRPPSPVPEGSDEGSSPRPSVVYVSPPRPPSPVPEGSDKFFRCVSVFAPINAIHFASIEMAAFHQDLLSTKLTTEENSDPIAKFDNRKEF